MRVRHVHLYGTDSLEAADVFDNTDAVQGDDAAQRGQGHSSSFTSSMGVMAWQINVS